jgi:hypothetical protein
MTQAHLILTGIPAAPGLTHGKTVILRKQELEVPQFDIDDVEQEIRRMHSACGGAKVEIVEKTPGQPVRQEESPIKTYGVRLYNISINGIEYDKSVEKQIQTQQQAIMNVQTAMANAKKAEQDAITIAKQGEAEAAKAKWEQEVVKAKMVTQAEAQRKVAEEEVKTAELNKRRDILEGEGIAAKKRLVMQADGALQQKLETYVTVQKYWAEAFSKYGGNVVPQIQSGGGGTVNGATMFMEMMGMKAARDLNIDLKTK